MSCKVSVQQSNKISYEVVGMPRKIRFLDAEAIDCKCGGPTYLVCK